MNTNLKQKKKYFPKFIKKMKEQLEHGGNRYNLPERNDKEMTDLVCELAGNDWILGNIVKYAGEYRNMRYEQNLYKIAVYAFILWLKEQNEFNKGKDLGEKK